ncbi:arylsulfatase B [Thalassoroseus pseudoceratinae]|uniref:arylsulfatase B n=1 Tax=Thalassoroseus pseudoceratinae TaxID=2713176 RepID=UPI00141F31A9|nr:arylsulfatase [Thalassoroseus pseudoceratinae]
MPTLSIRKLLTVIAVVIAAGPCWIPTVAQAAPPNIVFIISDDQGWNDIGYHNESIKTPNLDRLAQSGTKLTQHYVNPTCSPTRAALMAGRYASRFGILTPLADAKKLPTNQTLPKSLAEAGYSTHISGKWHIGAIPEARPLKYGFDSTYGYLRGQIDPYTHLYKNGNQTWHRNDELISEEGHATDLITDEAVRIIEASEDKAKPFFLYVAYSVPHYPLKEPKKWLEMYSEDTFNDPWRRLFAASLSHMDDGIGQIADALQKTGQDKDTLIVFVSDNGGQKDWSAPKSQYSGTFEPHTTLGNNEPLRGWKTDLYEGGIRVPSFAVWPDQIPAGKTLDVPTHIVDWFPTLLSIAAKHRQDNLTFDGQNIWPLLSKPTDAKPTPRTFYWRTPDEMAVRVGDWKLITNRKFERKKLFNLADDPNETRNLASQMPEQLEALVKKLRTLRSGD